MNLDGIRGILRSISSFNPSTIVSVLAMDPLLSKSFNVQVDSLGERRKSGIEDVATSFSEEDVPLIEREVWSSHEEPIVKWSKPTGLTDEAHKIHLKARQCGYWVTSLQHEYEKQKALNKLKGEGIAVRDFAYS